MWLRNDEEEVDGLRETKPMRIHPRDRPLEEPKRRGSIAVNAQRPERHWKWFPRDSGHPTSHAKVFESHLECLPGLDQRTRCIARHEPSVGQIAAVDKTFSPDLRASDPRGSGDDLAARLGVSEASRPMPRQGLQIHMRQTGGIFNGVIQPTVQLHVMEWNVPLAGQTLKHPDLLQEQQLQLRGSDLHATTTEVRTIPGSRMGPQSNAVLGGQKDASAHRHEIAGMSSASDIG